MPVQDGASRRGVPRRAYLETSYALAIASRMHTYSVRDCAAVARNGFSGSLGALMSMLHSTKDPCMVWRSFGRAEFERAGLRARWLSATLLCLALAACESSDDTSRDAMISGIQAQDGGRGPAFDAALPAPNP